jgi:hypothetical protein
VVYFVDVAALALALALVVRRKRFAEASVAAIQQARPSFEPSSRALRLHSAATAVIAGVVAIAAAAGLITRLI